MNEEAFDLSPHALAPETDAAAAQPDAQPRSQPPAQPDAPREIETFGSFLIGEMEFALPVGVVQEVVNEPDDVSPVPLSPSYMIGLFNLRGMIVPMIDLRQIFGLPASEDRGGRKITIIEDGEMHIGLVFDRTGEVIHARRSERVAFHSRENGIKDVISEGVLKLDGGRRLLQILDPYAILKLEKVPRVAKDEAAARQRAAKGKRQHCISFEVGHSKYAFDLEYVQEVMEVPEIKHSVLTHGHVLGTIDLRGRIVPIVDFRGFVGKQRTDSRQVAASQSNKLLIMNLLEGQIGLLVYSIESIIPYYPEDVLPISKLAMPHEAIFKGCLAVQNSDLVMLFDHAETMKQPDLVAAAKCCQELYPEGVAEDAISAASKQRRTFITFSAETSFAMDISKVREVIDCPAELMKPPVAPDAVAGLFNLRDEIITLVDLRRLYGLPATEVAVQKVVIFQCDDQKYGILVDGVNEIIMTTADKVLPYQSSSSQVGTAATAQDVSEMLQVTQQNEQSKSLMVLDVAAMVRHTVSQ